MTEQQRKEYVANGGQECPFCGANDLATGPFEVGNVGTVWCNVECLDCHASWDDIYTLTSIEPTEHVGAKP